MRKPTLHPDEEQLLRYSDGELSSRAAGNVNSHLKACWQCRTALEEIETTVGACVRYRTSVLQQHLPAPPAPWTDIYRSFAEIDASLDKPSLADRFTGVLSFPMRHARKWVPVAAALMLATGLFYRYRLMPSVQAAELLNKAILAADAHPAKPHRLQVRTKAHSFTRMSGSHAAVASNLSDRETLNSLKTLFQDANYNWDDPLSAKSYAAWRNGLKAKNDEVIETRDSYRVRTATDSGDLMQATLQLRSHDLEPVEGRFEFRNQEWVEITSLPVEPEPSTAALPSAVTPAPETHAAPATIPMAPLGAAITISGELQVMAALHQIGADLGDPVQVSRSSSEILVSGSGIAAQRRDEIQRALAGLPNVAVRFNDSAPAVTQPALPAPESTTPADNRQLQARIAEQVGGRANYEQLASQVFDMNEPMMSRVYALRSLEQHFPAPLENQLNARDLETLRRLQREHVSALRDQIQALDQALKPVLPGSRRTPEAAFTNNTWQAATEELFQSARSVEKLLAAMFGASPADSAAQERIPAQLASSLAQFRANVEAYDRLLARSEK
jgi:anti-sigma factor RsiW